MKYVIDLDEGQLSYIKNVCPGLATMGIASAIDDARPLSELCEEEAKRYDTKHCEHFSNGETQSAAESAIIAGAFRRFNAGL